ncbi:MAG: hypothetical protein Q7S55_05550 [Nanoarchaeota archaeon]|nr:hypothetical protein [Nanoarchaeota archaeon]
MAQVLENIVGDLLAYKQLEPSTMLSASELMKERRTHPNEEIRKELRGSFFYTSDGILYFVENNTPKIVITTKSHNLVLKHIDEAFVQLTQNGNYIPDAAESEAAIHAQDSLVLDLNQMRLQKFDEESNYLTVSTVNYSKLNPVERRIVERVFGQGKDLVENMKMLKDNHSSEARIYVLNPEYVREHAEEGAVARASWLNGFDYISHFFANDCGINNLNRVRGVRRAIVSEQTTSSVVPLEDNASFGQPKPAYNSAEEYAKRMLDGIPSGTVMDWKK